MNLLVRPYLPADAVPVRPGAETDRFDVFLGADPTSTPPRALRRMMRSGWDLAEASHNEDATPLDVYAAVQAAVFVARTAHGMDAEHQVERSRAKGARAAW